MTRHLADSDARGGAGERASAPQAQHRLFDELVDSLDGGFAYRFAGRGTNLYAATDSAMAHEASYAFDLNYTDICLCNEWNNLHLYRVETHNMTCGGP